MNRAALTLLIGMVAALGTAAVGSVLVARALGPAGRGEVAIVAALTGISTVIGAAGTNVAFRGMYPRGLVRTRSLMDVILRNSILTGVMSGICVALFLTRGSAQHVFAVSIAAGVYTVVSVWALVSMDVMKSQGRHSYSGLADFLGALSGTALAAALIALDLMSVPAALAALAVGCLVRTLCVLDRRTREELSQPKDRGRGAHLTREGRRYFGFTLGQHLALQSDVLVAGFFLTKSELGIYGAASTLASVSRVPGVAIGHILGHKAALGSTFRALRREILLGGVVGLLLAGVLGLFSEPIVRIVYGSEFSEASGVLVVLMLGQALLAIYPIVARVLAGMGQPRSITVSGYAGGAVLLASMAWFTSRFGTIGAAWATVVTYVVITTLVVVLIPRRSGR